ncbi:hypothetical protein J6590_034411 [Homalodisca vitripennis]|nr:hypothetical protein J6590_034411 [Homalodisca vitripennis]
MVSVRVHRHSDCSLVAVHETVTNPGFPPRPIATGLRRTRRSHWAAGGVMSPLPTPLYPRPNSLPCSFREEQLYHLDLEYVHSWLALSARRSPPRRAALYDDVNHNRPCAIRASAQHASRLRLHTSPRVFTCLTRLTFPPSLDQCLSLPHTNILN